jgi:hypothetical protein
LDALIPEWPGPTSEACLNEGFSATAFYLSLRKQGII